MSENLHDRVLFTTELEPADVIVPLIRLMRPGDWVKNIFVLPALMFALPTALKHQAADVHSLGSLALNTMLAFVAFCLLSSGFYAVNDVFDAEKDREHPVKCLRPVASGAIAPNTAMGFGLV